MKYTIAEFRKNIREVLNAVDQGETVTINRYESEYAIIRINHDAPLPEGTGLMILKGQKKKDAERMVDFIKHTSKMPNKKQDAPKAELCPHGAGVGLCKKSECNRRYAK